MQLILHEYSILPKGGGDTRQEATWSREIEGHHSDPWAISAASRKAPTWLYKTARAAAMH